MLGNDIVFISDADWNAKRELPVHHVVRLLANRHRVFYVDNFGGIRRLGLKDTPRILSKLRRVLSRQLVPPPPIAEGAGSIRVFQPFIFPTSRLSNIIGRFNALLLRRALRRLMAHYEIQAPIIWTRVPSDIVWRAIAGIPRSALVYQVVDQFVQSPTIPNHARSRLERYEYLFAHSADIIFASGVGLYNDKRRINPNTHFSPNGVDTRLFSRESSPNETFNQIRRPIIGFAGSLSSVVDYELISQAAAITPEWSYVLVGPVSPGVDLGSLKRLQNVHFTGPINHAELPSYVAGFDCGLIPYIIDQFTQFTFPSKLAEYLAMGLPVVSTQLPELSGYRDVVALVDDAEGMVRAIRSFLDDTTIKELREKRIKVAQQLSWGTIVSGMEQAVEDFLKTQSGGLAAV